MAESHYPVYAISGPTLMFNIVDPMTPYVPSPTPALLQDRTARTSFPFSGPPDPSYHPHIYSE
eukprot:759938-Hanusia_phi.AAC.1